MVIFYSHSSAFKKRQRLTFIFYILVFFWGVGWGEVAYRRNNELVFFFFFLEVEVSSFSPSKSQLQ